MADAPSLATVGTRVDASGPDFCRLDILEHSSWCKIPVVTGPKTRYMRAAARVRVSIERRRFLAALAALGAGAALPEALPPQSAQPPSPLVRRGPFPARGNQDLHCPLRPQRLRLAQFQPMGPRANSSGCTRKPSRSCAGRMSSSGSLMSSSKRSTGLWTSIPDMLDELSSVSGRTLGCGGRELLQS